MTDYEQAEQRYEELQRELAVLYERSRRALDQHTIAFYDALILFRETELATILH